VTPPLHDCPGKCGLTNVPRHRFACAKCWHRLPTQYRDAITDAYSRLKFESGAELAHLRAMSHARRWYRENGS
jgi:hypothetical protein